MCVCLCLCVQGRAEEVYSRVSIFQRWKPEQYVGTGLGCQGDKPDPEPAGETGEPTDSADFYLLKTRHLVDSLASYFPISGEKFCSIQHGGTRSAGGHAPSRRLSLADPQTPESPALQCSESSLISIYLHPQCALVKTFYLERE